MNSTKNQNNRPLQVWLLKAGEPIPQLNNGSVMRTGHLAKTLAERGHKVTWWTSSWDHRNKRWLFENDHSLHQGQLEIRLLRGCGYKQNISLMRILDHRILANKFKKQALERIQDQKNLPDVILACLPPYDSAYEAIQIAKKYKVPIVVDLRDEWPDLFLSRLPKGLKWLGRVLLFREFQIAYSAIRNATGLTSMMSGMLNWGLKVAQRPKTSLDQIFYLGSPKPQKTSCLEIQHPSLLELKRQCEGKLTITYIGTFGKFADPRYLIPVARELSPIQFIFAGTGPLLEECIHLKGDAQNIHFPGWLRETELSQLMSITDIGVCPNTSFREALPNKAISYFSYGKPIINFHQGDLESIIQNEKVGWNLPPLDSESFKKLLLQIRSKPSPLIFESQHVESVYERLFRSDLIYTDFANYIERIANQKR